MTKWQQMLVLERARHLLPFDHLRTWREWTNISDQGQVHFDSRFTSSVSMKNSRKKLFLHSVKADTLYSQIHLNHKRTYGKHASRECLEG